MGWTMTKTMTMTYSKEAVPLSVLRGKAMLVTIRRCAPRRAVEPLAFSRTTNLFRAQSVIFLPKVFNYYH
jgi:hypothetical protein